MASHGPPPPALRMLLDTRSMILANPCLHSTKAWHVISQTIVLRCKGFNFRPKIIFSCQVSACSSSRNPYFLSPLLLLFPFHEYFALSGYLVLLRIKLSTTYSALFCFRCLCFHSFRFDKFFTSCCYSVLLNIAVSSAFNGSVGMHSMFIFVFLYL